MVEERGRSVREPYIVTRMQVLSNRNFSMIYSRPINCPGNLPPIVIVIGPFVPNRKQKAVMIKYSSTMSSRGSSEDG